MAFSAHRKSKNGQNKPTFYAVELIATIPTIVAVPFEPSGTPSIDLFNRPIANAAVLDVKMSISDVYVGIICIDQLLFLSLSRRQRE